MQNKKYIQDNINLISRDNLENVTIRSLNIIELQERQIDILKKDRLYERKFMLFVYIIMTCVCLVYHGFSLIKGLNYNVTEILAVFISSIATGFCYIKVIQLTKRYFKNEDTIDYKQIHLDVKLMRNIATDDLKYKMSQALENEDYTTASTIRDELNKRA